MLCHYAVLSKCLTTPLSSPCGNGTLYWTGCEYDLALHEWCLKTHINAVHARPVYAMVFVLKFGRSNHSLEC